MFHPTSRVRQFSSPAAAVVAALIACGALSACSGSSDVGGVGSTSPTTAASTSTATVTRTATASRTVTPTAGGPSDSGGSSASEGSSSAGGSGGTLADCRESQLTATIDPRHVPGSDTHGDHAIIVDFRNTSASACRIHGYPGAALVNAAGEQVTEATRTIRGTLLGLPPSRHSLPSVTLKPGVYASAGLEGVSQQKRGTAQAGCNGRFLLVVVTPPNTRTAVPFDVKWPICYSFDVHPTNLEKNPPQ